MGAILARWDVPETGDPAGIRAEPSRPAADPTPVLPDGCADVILCKPPDGQATLALTPVTLRRFLPPARPGTRMTGFRLAPGAHVASRPLLQVLSTHGSPDDAPAAIEACCETNTDFAETIACLALPGQSVAGAARDLGLSLRSLQRLMQDRESASPAYWLQLARARRTAARLGTAPLADLALEAGYADQPHMTRAFVRFFGMPPTRLVARAELLSQLKAPGLGTTPRTAK